MPDPAAILRDAETIAVVGASAKAGRTSHQIAAYLQRAGYRLVPVNPRYDEVLGEPCYDDLASIPDDVEIDVVDVFRAPEHTAEVVRDAMRRQERTGRAPVVWTQLGVSSAEAKALAEDAGLPYVENRCTKVEHARL
jgi:predicted CoA-binding protein